MVADNVAQPVLIPPLARYLLDIQATATSQQKGQMQESVFVWLHIKY